MLRNFSSRFVLGEEEIRTQNENETHRKGELEWINCAQHEGLLARKRGEHIDQKTRTYLAELLEKNPEDRKLICREYRLSASTCLRLRREYKKPTLRNKIHMSDRLMAVNVRDNIKELILEMITPPAPPITIQQIKKRVFVDLQVS